MGDSDNQVGTPVLEAIQSLLKQGRYVEAAALCERACSEPGADARVWQILGAIHGQDNDVVRAESCTRHALAMNPGLVSAYRNLAILLQRQGQA